MNFKELKQKLIDRKVPEEMYYFGDRMPDETYIFRKRNDGIFEAFYSERGHKSGLREFSSEEEACEFFWNDLTRGRY